MEKIIVELDVKSKEGVKEVEKLNKKLSSTKTEANNAGKSLDTISGGAIGKFKALQGSVGGVVKGFKSLKFAIAASGIGLLLVGILAVGKAFTSSEEGQNKFAKILGVIGAITGNLADLLADLGEKIINVFENPKKSIQDFANLIKDNIINRFNGLLELIPSLGKAVKQLFTGDFSGAAETATNAVAKVTLGTENLTESIKGAGNALKEFGEQNIKEGKAAAKVADDRAKADKIERDLIVDKAKAENEIAELRLIAKQQNKFSAKEREEALIKAGEIQDELISREGEVLKLRAEAITLENTFSRSNKENLTAEAQAIAAVIKAETERTNFKRQLARELTAAQNEQESERKARAKEQQIIDDAENKKVEEKIKKEKDDAIKKAELESKTEKERLEKIAQIQDDFKKRREEEAANTEVLKLELEKERKILELEQLGSDEQAKADVIMFYSKKISKEKENISKKLAKDELALEQSVADAKNNIANNAANLLIQLGGKAAKIGKAIAVAQTIRSSIEGTQNAFKTASSSPIAAFFPAYPFIQAGLAGAFGALQVRKIVSSPETSSGGGSSSGGGAPSVASPSIPSLPPAFNVVGQSDTNQLADAIGGQSKSPQRAYVVSGDITTSQELDRNIITGASI
jgi:hypothetical protein